MWSNTQDFNFLILCEVEINQSILGRMSWYHEKTKSSKHIEKFRSKRTSQSLDSELLTDPFQSWKGLFFHGMWGGMKVAQI